MIRRMSPTWFARLSAIFGPGRCLFGSNFPIEKLWTSYAELLSAHRDAVASFAPKEQQAILHDTAMRVYRIAP